MVHLKWLIVLSTLICTIVSSETQEEESCPVRLPQDVPWDSQCYRRRGLDLISKRYTYGLKQGTTAVPFNRLDKTVTEYAKFLGTNPFLYKHAVLWRLQLNYIESRQALYLSDKVFLTQSMNLTESKKMRKFFKDQIKSPHNLIRPYMKIPSDEEPFNNSIHDWISDGFFAEQRLAGANPMTIQKITLSSKYGMHYQNLMALLNPKFDWIKAVHGVLEDVTDNKSLQKAIKNGRLFVLYHPLSTHLKTMRPDIIDKDPRRHMWNHLSPIAIFATKDTKDGGKKLLPVAIQMDAKPDAPVFTPNDGDNWMLAKLNVQLTDLGDSQMVEHLTKVHFVVEAFCLSYERQISNQHPLYEMLKYHCLGIFTTNTFAAPELLDVRKALHEIFAYGNEGAGTFVREAAVLLHWEDLEPRNNIKRRGVDDKKQLPYYPYRDDSKVIYSGIKNMVKDYVNAFYKNNRDVKYDEEIQKFAYEISANGDGRIRGFPSRITTKWSLIKTITRMIWIATGQHCAIGYNVAEYATYVPNVSTKLYNVFGVPPNVFNGARLNNRETASLQLSFFFKIGSFRYDRIFDYADKLQNPKAKEIIAAHKKVFHEDIQEELEERNKERLAEGHLTYPVLLPKWIPNGVQE